jgi:hypothetical protein
MALTKSNLSATLVGSLLLGFALLFAVLFTISTAQVIAVQSQDLILSTFPVTSARLHLSGLIGTPTTRFELALSAGGQTKLLIRASTSDIPRHTLSVLPASTVTFDCGLCRVP